MGQDVARKPRAIVGPTVLSGRGWSAVELAVPGLVLEIERRHSSFCLGLLDVDRRLRLPRPSQRVFRHERALADLAKEAAAGVRGARCFHLGRDEFLLFVPTEDAATAFRVVEL